MRTALVVLITASLLFAVPIVAAEPEWALAEEDSNPAGRAYHAVAYDEARDRVVMFGGNSSQIPSMGDTWEYDGPSSRWVRRRPETSPTTRYGHAMAYDAARGRVVLFGGSTNSGLRGDTWEWDGHAWIERTAGLAPSARYFHGMAYDAARGRVVLFGGFSGSVNLADTWEWDGSSWLQRTPASSPIARRAFGIAYDPARGRTVIFGGNGTPAGGLTLEDTWEWDGTNWVEKTPVSSPGGGEGHTMTYDASLARVVYVGAGSDSRSGTWAWNGTAWTKLAPAVSVPPRDYAALAFDASRGRAVLCGGTISQPYPTLDTWEWTGATWLEIPPAAPGKRHRTAMAYDSARGRLVMFGGHVGTEPYRRDTWEWDGTAWIRRVTPASPPERQDHAMAYDSARGVVVLYGGRDGASFSDTWEYDGVTWTERSPATAIEARYGHAMAYDAARGRVVMFGGFTAGGRSGDTFEWDGNDWTWRQVSPAPGPRYLHVMAYDSVRQRVVLFGGLSAFGSSQTWEWDGSTWTHRFPSQTPTAGSVDVAAFDDARGRFVVVQGASPPAPTRTWEWDGTSWTERKGEQPSEFSDGAAAYHGASGRVVLLGTLFYSPQHARTSTLGAPARCGQGAGVVTFSPGSGSSSPDPLRALGPPDGLAVALGLSGTLVVELDDDATDGPGADLTVHERGAAAGDVNENFRVEASADGINYRWLGTCAGGPCSLDLASAGLASARLVRISDLTPAEPGVPAGTSGADVDAVTARDCADAEACNGLDDDGDLDVDEGCDDDGDDYCDAWRVVTGNPAVCPNGGGDCQDEVASVRPGGPQLCNGFNDDCSDPSWPSLAAAEADLDGDGYRLCAGDCNDAVATTFPGAPQLCNGVNDNCSDPSWPAVPASELDADGDSFRQCAECNDARETVYPGAPQICDGINNDCNDPTWPTPPPADVDSDGDAYRVCQNDCNDGNPGIHPGVAEVVADGIDQNCNGGDLCWRDQDGDDFGHPVTTTTSADLDCADPGEAPVNTDCNDASATVYPGAAELVADGIDQSCDGIEACYRDDDLDTYGTEHLIASADLDCVDPLESPNATDCDDANPAVHPGALEACNGIDDDCDALVDDDALGQDSDSDGVFNVCDNCRLAANPTQLDTDGDQVGNACDNCVIVSNPDQLDPDSDARGTACDNCPLEFNPAQDDTDLDRVGDACDNCLLDPNEAQSDFDSDQEGDVCDLDDGLILLLRTEPDYVEWQPETGPTAFHVYQGDLSVLRSSGIYTQLPGSNPLAERDCGVADLFVEDFDTPPAGAVQFSMVTGVVGGIEGSLGQDSAGVPRANTNPCP